MQLGAVPVQLRRQVMAWRKQGSVTVYTSFSPPVSRVFSEPG